MGTITTGDDVALPVQLKKNNASFVINAGATIKAAVINSDGTRVLSEVVTLNNLATGADLANSLVVAEFTSAQTAAIKEYGSAILEIQVDDSGKLTWTTAITVVKGNIS